jgi:hypothetical protein
MQETPASVAAPIAMPIAVPGFAVPGFADARTLPPESLDQVVVLGTRPVPFRG